jgi:hypothetical protein
MVVVFDLVSLYGTTSMLSKDEKVAIVAAVASIGLSVLRPLLRRILRSLLPSLVELVFSLLLDSS